MMGLVRLYSYNLHHVPDDYRGMISVFSAAEHDGRL